jgi:outer membrane protein OmpA-like peptidoglycan-associated protein
MRQIVLMALVFSFLLCSAYGQEKDSLYNPSFEDIARHSQPPRGWIDCGFSNESPPDVQPSGAWRVYRPAYHGNTYLGMVTRENDTWESVGQKLNNPLRKGKCYAFSLYMCMSSEYWSAVVPDSLKSIQLNDVNFLPDKNFDNPIKLRIWGGNGYCNKMELLDESPLVENHTWEKYNFRFEPKNEITHIILEAFYKTPTLFPYNGNVLIDYGSYLVTIPCDAENPLVEEPTVRFLQPIEKIEPRTNRVKVDAVIRNITTSKQITFKVNNRNIQNFNFDPVSETFTTMIYLMPGKNVLELYANNEIGEASDETSVYIPVPEKNTEDITVGAGKKLVQPKEYAILKELNNKKPKKGEIIQIDRLYFSANDSTLAPGSVDALDELCHFLKLNDQLIIEVGGHTSGGDGKRKISHDFAKMLSTSRARTVADYLITHGILEDRVMFKGYGPDVPLASNKTVEGRKKNRRVEIKILSISS